MPSMSSTVVPSPLPGGSQSFTCTFITQDGTLSRLAVSYVQHNDVTGKGVNNKATRATTNTAIGRRVIDTYISQ